MVVPVIMILRLSLSLYRTLLQLFAREIGLAGFQLVVHDLLPPGDKNKQLLALEMKALSNIRLCLGEDGSIFEAAKDGRDGLFELHEGDVAADARAGTVTEAQEILLQLGLVRARPALGTEFQGVEAPDPRVAMRGVRRRREHGPGAEMLTAYAGAAGGDDTREADGNGGPEA